MKNMVLQPLALKSGIDGSLDLTVTCQYCTDTGHIKDNCLRQQQNVASEQFAMQSVRDQEALWSETPVEDDNPDGSNTIELRQHVWDILISNPLPK